MRLYTLYFPSKLACFRCQTIRLGLENIWFSQKEGFKLCRLVGPNHISNSYLVSYVKKPLKRLKLWNNVNLTIKMIGVVHV